MKTFDFGQNWLDFSRVVDEERLNDALDGLRLILQRDQLKDCKILDLGCGSGIHSIAAARLGAEVTCMDVNPKCLEATEINFKRFEPSRLPSPDRLRCGSILDESFLTALEQYDIVYAWGVLHHTGNMKQAIRNATALVKPGGDLALALYNRHWSSPFWKAEKWCYVHSPRLIQMVLAFLFTGIIAAAKFLYTWKNPFRRRRGMSFLHDVVDWVGGYPYEYASLNEVEILLAELNCQMVWHRKAAVPTGCNEYLFRRIPEISTNTRA